MTRIAIAIVAAAILPAASSCAAASVNTIYSFTGASGANPEGTPIVDAGGAIFGVTYFGGASNLGTVYQLTPPRAPGAGWTAATLYSFAGGSDGANPYGALAMDAAGALYGATLYGGASDAGTVFQLVPPSQTGGVWIENVLYTFSGGSDGANPCGSLLFGANGVLFGTTSFGGALGYGVVFHLAPPAAGNTWSETVMYNFTGGADGANPGAGVVFGPGSFLYGTTYAGGSANLGTVFLLTPQTGGGWRETVLHSFTGGHDGASPDGGLVVNAKSVLYGTTEYGGSTNHGTAYQLVALSASGGIWTYGLLYAFSAPSGSQPYGSLVVDSAGNLYGTTFGGGAAQSGTVFELQPPAAAGAWTETILHSFTGNGNTGSPAGSGPFSGLVFAPGSKVLYGTTFYGGMDAEGTVFRLNL